MKDILIPFLWIIAIPAGLALGVLLFDPKMIDRYQRACKYTWSAVWPYRGRYAIRRPYFYNHRARHVDRSILPVPMHLRYW